MHLVPSILNRVIRWVQRHPRGLTYQQLPEPRVLLAVGDSAFQAPTDDDIAAGKDPLVMRGYMLAWAHRIDGNATFAAGSDSRGGSAASANSVDCGMPQILHTKDTASDDLLSDIWAICPAPNSYLLQVIRSKGISVAHVHVNDITKHDTYHRWLKKHWKTSHQVDHWITTLRH